MEEISMEQLQLFKYAFMGLFLLVGLYQIFDAIKALIYINGSERVEAKVIERVLISKNDSHTWHPVLEYYRNGEKQTFTSPTSGGKSVGETMIIYIDKKGKVREKRSAVSLLIFGIAWVLCVLFITWKYVL